MVYEEYSHEGTKKLLRDAGIIICLLSVIMFLFTWSLAKFTEYDNLQSSLSPLAKEKFNQEVPDTQISTIHNSLVNECYLTGRDTVNMPSSLIGFEVPVSCSELKSAKATQLPDVAAKAMVDRLYYKTYDCKNFPDCMNTLSGNEKYNLLFTKTAHDFYNLFWLYAVIFIIISIFMIVAGYEYWHERFRILGIIFLIAGSPYFILQIIKLAFPSGIMTSIGAVTAPMMEAISFKFLISIVIALVFLLSSYIGVHVLEKSYKKPKKLSLREKFKAREISEEEARELEQVRQITKRKLKPVKETIPKKPVPEGRLSKKQQMAKKKKVKMRVREWVIQK